MKRKNRIRINRLCYEFALCRGGRLPFGQCILFWDERCWVWI